MKIKSSYIALLCIAVIVSIASIAVVRVHSSGADGLSDREQAKRELLQKAEAFVKDKNYPAAVQMWQSALAIDPGDTKIKELVAAAEKEFVTAEVAGQAVGPTPADVKLINIANPPAGIARVWTLAECIDTAFRNHLPLQIAEKNVKLAEMKLFEARRGLLPNVKLAWEETYGTVNERNYVGRKSSIEGQHTVYNGGENWFLMRQAEINLNIVKEERNRIKNDLILQVKKNYYTLARSKENLRIQLDLKQDVDKIYGIAKKAYDMGMMTKVDYLNVYSLYAQVDFQCFSAKGDIGIAELILKQTMYIDPKERVDVNADLAFRKVDVDSDEVLRAAYVNRPEMKINSMMIQYYTYTLSAAKARFWPKVDLMGNWGLAKESFCAIDNGARINTTTGDIIVDPDRKMEQQWYAGIKASVPLWGNTVEYSYTREQWVPVVSAYQGTEAKTKAVKINILDALKYTSDKQAADVDVDRARQEYLKSKQDITLEASESCFAYEKALIQLGTAENKLLYYERDLEIKRYKASMGESLGGSESSGPGGEVAEAIIRVAAEKFSYISSLVECHLAIAAINKAIGIPDYYTVPPENAGT